MESLARSRGLRSRGFLLPRIAALAVGAAYWTLAVLPGRAALAAARPATTVFDHAYLTYPTPATARSVAAGDFDGDGSTDVAVLHIMPGTVIPGGVSILY